MRKQIFVLLAVIISLFQISVAGENYWETHGPYGGDMWEVQFNAGSRGLCCVGGEGGLFVSFDDGNFWEKRTPLDLWLDQSDLYCGYFSACPAQPGLIYAVFSDYYNAAVYKSGDSGMSWEKLSVPLQAETISAIACDPSDPDLVFISFSEGGG
ncbi:MAG: hypothetical protein JW941_07590 [Candidatus Coatesbacteria bacterium]|nr:hypothetical protein [Candidatus Coatesbacteria bacterium]